MKDLFLLSYDLSYSPFATNINFINLKNKYLLDI